MDDTTWYAIAAITDALTPAELDAVMGRFLTVNPRYDGPAGLVDILDVCARTGVYDDITGPFLASFRSELPRSPSTLYAVIALAAAGDTAPGTHQVADLLRRAGITDPAQCETR